MTGAISRSFISETSDGSVSKLPAESSGEAAVSAESSGGNVLLLVKTAILLEWVRIFVPRNVTRSDTFWWLAHVAMALSITSNLAFLFVTIFHCSLVQMFWKPWLDGQCVPYYPVDVVSGSFNLLMDLVILIIPQRRILAIAYGEA
ncbi:hypothetical protein V8F20_003323 [Naviculisporaceae sp. PSN 640]